MWILKLLLVKITNKRGKVLMNIVKLLPSFKCCKRRFWRKTHVKPHLWLRQDLKFNLLEKSQIQDVMKEDFVGRIFSQSVWLAWKYKRRNCSTRLRPNSRRHKRESLRRKNYVHAVNKCAPSCESLMNKIMS